MSDKYDEHNHTFYGVNSSDKNNDDDLIDDFVIESLLEEEIREFRKLLRLKKLMEIRKKDPHYII
ncbi:MAG: hypothetical protein ACTSVU_00795 [Promethearchaeota archaeon]